MLLRAVMYPLPGSPNAYPCFDSSPLFKALPATLICRGYNFTYNHTAIDDDLDSLVYSWDRPYNPPQSNPQALNYKIGFSPTNPTPDQNRNINNIPASLNSLTGITELAVYSGVGVKKYITVVQVDAYRESQKIATVYREIPISVFDCPDLPGFPGVQNEVPIVLIDGVPTNNTISTITAGQTVSIPIQVIDNDRINVSPFSQILTMIPDGLLFTRSKTGPSKGYASDPNGEPCIISSKDVHPCAYLRGNPAPFVDATATPPVTVVKGLGVIGVEFVWQTDCKHIQTKTGFPGTNEGVYNFVMRVTDDHCPIPGINYPTVTVKVRDPIPLEAPIVKGISVLLDGTTKFSWIPPLDSARQFNPPERRTDHYESDYAETQNNQAPAFWLPEDRNITNYQQDKRSTDLSPYDLNNLNIPNSGYNILAPKGLFVNGVTSNYYVRMRTWSGCTDSSISVWSQPARIMELAATPIGVAPNPTSSTARLNWNRPKPLNARTYPYLNDPPYTYESPTHFYIYANDSISNGGVANANNWYIVGDTNATTYNVDATSCSNYVGFRVEARDTVITWKEGSGVRSDSLDTLYFSTFSMVDTMFMKALSFIPNPTLDTIEVRADGTVFLRINLQGKRTTGSYRIFQNDTTAKNLLTTVNALQDSVVVLSGADIDLKKILIQAIDACNPGDKSYISEYNTVIPTGFLSDPCKGEYTLNWIQPSSTLGTVPARPNNINRYKVYADYDDGNGYVLVSTINNRNTTTAVVGGMTRGITVKFKVEAIDNRGGINSSAIHTYQVANDLATNALVLPPTPRCTYVNDNGSVTLSWIPAVDDVNNFNVYDIQYKREDETNWTDIPGDDDDDLDISATSYTVTGINAQQAQYNFRISSLAGCDGRTDSLYNEINSIFLEGEALVNGQQNYTDLTWNLAGPDYGQRKFFAINSAENGSATFTLEKAAQTPGSEAVDVQLGPGVCSLPVDYRLFHVDTLFKPATGFQCTARSSVAQTLHEDKLPPDAENLAMLTFNKETNQLEAHWVGDAAGADSLKFSTINGTQSGLPIVSFLTDDAIDIDTNATSSPKRRYFPFEIATIDARDTVRSAGSKAKDECNNEAVEGVVYHKSMNVDVEWKICDSVNVIDWTQYVGWNADFGIEYEVFYKTASGTQWRPITPVSVTTDSTINHLITQGGETYYYVVRATSLDPSVPLWATPESNVDSSYSVYEDTPLYSYLTYATVLPTGQVEVEYYRDTLTPVKSYTVFRGDNPNELLPLEYYDADELQGIDRITHVDNTADVNAQQYYYQVVSQNDCEIITSNSNFGRTIHLEVQSDDEAMRNILRWNRYLDWDSTVAYYNVYRTSNEIYSTSVYKQVQPNSAYDYNVFVDEIADDVSGSGKYYYRVEAVQGPLLPSAVNGYPNSLTSAVSNSNIAEALQNPLMYVPNAFAPDGVNRSFGPKGQFFKFSQFEMTIYNRWGEQIYETKDINRGWDGTVDGKDASLGSYVYMIRYLDGDGNEKRKKGTVTLIR
jgi:gliding motility-associated-like protein